MAGGIDLSCQDICQGVAADIPGLAHEDDRSDACPGSEIGSINDSPHIQHNDDMLKDLRQLIQILFFSVRQIVIARIQTAVLCLP